LLIEKGTFPLRRVFIAGIPLLPILLELLKIFSYYKLYPMFDLVVDTSLFLLGVELVTSFLSQLGFEPPL